MSPPAASPPVSPEGRWPGYALLYMAAAAWTATAVLLLRGIATPSAAQELATALLAAAAPALDAGDLPDG